MKKFMIMGLTKKRRKIQNGSIFKIITYFINCGKYAFLRFTTIWIFSFYYPAWMPSENDDDFGEECDLDFKFWVRFWSVLNLVKKNKNGF
jgi:hypothetical protein